MSFLITTGIEATEILNTGETGVISATGALSVPGTVALVVQGRANVVNAGLISGSTGITIGTNVSDATVVNTGLITGRDFAIDQFAPIGSDAFFDVVNSGQIMAAGTEGQAIRSGGNIYINNSGVIQSSGRSTIEVDGPDAVLNLTNTGTIATMGASQVIASDAGSDIITNTGTIRGSISTGGGVDLISILGGSVTGAIRGGTGADQYDIRVDGVSIVEFAGEGRDQITTDRDWILDDNLEVLILVGRARAGTGNDLSNDLTGNAWGNVLTGEGGADALFGARGSDQLLGGAGADYLQGEAGADRLTGGAGADVFAFTLMSDSTIGFSDTITDFARGQDDISLVSLDARPLTVTEDAFVFIGIRAFSAVGQVRIVDLGADVRVEINTVGTSGADSALLAKGVGTLAATDFIL